MKDDHFFKYPLRSNVPEVKCPHSQMSWPPTAVKCPRGQRSPRSKVPAFKRPCSQRSLRSNVPVVDTNWECLFFKWRGMKAFGKNMWNLHNLILSNDTHKFWWGYSTDLTVPLGARQPNCPRWNSRFWLFLVKGKNEGFRKTKIYDLPRGNILLIIISPFFWLMEKI